MPRYYSSYRTPRKTRKARPPAGSRKVATDLMRIIRNPFALSTDARIPDGRAHMSLPIKVQQVKDILLPASNDTLELLFFPGLQNAVTYWNIDDQNSPTGNTGVPIASHAPVSGTGAQNNATSGVVQWRTVSAGMRMSLVNNAVTNEGWFECARITLPKQSSGWQLANTNAADPANFYPSLATVNTFIPSDRGSLRNHPTYATGKLRDIDHVMFNLRATADVHEFNTLKDGAQDNSPYQFVDEGFDAIWVRVHGLGATTRLLMNYVLNQEIVYDESAELARAMTRFPNYPMVARMLRTYRSRQGTSAITVPMDISTPERRGGKRRKVSP